MSIRKYAFLVFGLVLAVTSWPLRPLHAADPGSFFLQVSPSPMVQSLKPGQTTVVDVQIRNAGTGTENLKIAARSFKYSSTTEDVVLDDVTPPEVAPWISFSAPTFSVQAGQLYTEKVTFAIPANVGFSYSFALLVSRQSAVVAEGGAAALQGSVAVFSLLNIDKPGATRGLEVVKFSSKQPIYEYLPATLNVLFRNTGNTIVLPSGNIFIQRSLSDKSPVSTLPVNSTKGYILPTTTRTFSGRWEDGFPVYKTVDGDNGTTKQQLVWNWADIGKLRIGRFTAKMVAVYNDGVRDVPIEADISFWVIPWKILLGVLVVFLLIMAGLYSLLIRPILRRRRRRFRKT